MSLEKHPLVSHQPRIRLALCATALIAALGVVPSQGSRPEAAAKRHRKRGRSQKAARAILPGERSRSAAASGLLVRDVVVSNTDPNLSQTDQEADGECSIAVDPQNPQHITVSAFSGNAEDNGGAAPIFCSEDGGATWTRRFSIPTPPPGHQYFPVDQTFDYGRTGTLFGSLMTVDVVNNAGFGNIFTGSTQQPNSAAAWNWFVDGGAAQSTAHLIGGGGGVDQPWLVVGPNPANLQQDNAYVGYLDFGQRGDGDEDFNQVQADDPSTELPVRVATAYNVGSGAPNFTEDAVVARPSINLHPGQRLAVDRRNGALYSFYMGLNKALDQNFDVCVTDYRLNRSLDGGRTWAVNGDDEGTRVLTGITIQATKLGGVNLPGNEASGAVDPNNGDVYYAMGDREKNGRRRLQLKVARIATGRDGRMVVKQIRLVSRAHVAMPQIAVAQNGTVGVFYYSYDGQDATGYARFSAHLSVSRNHGKTWKDTLIQTFLSAELPTSSGRQRVLGDYQQLKAVGDTFYGAYTANGVSFGRPFANHDPIFFRYSAQ